MQGQRQSVFAVSANTTAATGIAKPLPKADAVNLNATYMAHMATSIAKTRRASGKKAVDDEIARGAENVVQDLVLHSNTGPSATAASAERLPLRTALYNSMWETPAARAIWRNMGARLLIRARFDENRMVRSCRTISAFSMRRQPWFWCVGQLVPFIRTDTSASIFAPGVSSTSC